jgi:hypothetical protein
MGKAKPRAGSILPHCYLISSAFEGNLIHQLANEKNATAMALVELLCVSRIWKIRGAEARAWICNGDNNSAGSIPFDSAADLFG